MRWIAVKDARRREAYESQATPADRAGRARGFQPPPRAAEPEADKKAKRAKKGKAKQKAPAEEEESEEEEEEEEEEESGGGGGGGSGGGSGDEEDVEMEEVGPYDGTFLVSARAFLLGENGSRDDKVRRAPTSMMLTWANEGECSLAIAP